MITPFTVTPARLTLPVTDDDHIIGPATAPATLVEYGDYQCPYCGLAHPAVQELLRLRPHTLRYAYRHFPLIAVHPYAEVAAETAEAAGARGRFWQMHDWLFSHQDRLDPVHLPDGVAHVGLPADEVLGEVNSRVYRDRIERDFASGVRSGVNGTPTFFVNGYRHDGGYSMPELLDAVDRAAEAARRGPAQTGGRQIP
jgi:protein-disulfide isomerase